MKFKSKKIFLPIGAMVIVTTTSIIATSCGKQKDSNIKNDVSSRMNHSNNIGIGGEKGELKDIDYYEKKLAKLSEERYEWNSWFQSGAGYYKVSDFIEAIQVFLQSFKLQKDFLNNDDVWKDKTTTDMEKLTSNIPEFAGWIRKTYKPFEKSDLIESFLWFMKKTYYKKGDKELKDIDINEIEKAISTYFSQEELILNKKLQEAMFKKTFVKRVEKQTGLHQFTKK
ncbi:hypothetical protein MYMA111404_01525 [Mycoplasma marinum]|uniref:Lipoprotein n=1 Tax=Mycoplasma marinum TaxID=1937190 RepID=A0A4R0XSR2_9MOLU|nr:hypothetical protein [Mycoplasma marinum]TCG11480.1 hypothetical protein C4B24_01850 [Mycoplasma marinum]